MDIGLVSIRYAKALLKFATANGEEARVYEEMQAMHAAFRQCPEVHSALQNPTLSDKRKVLLMQTACVGDDVLSTSATRFFQLLARKRRTGMALFMAASYLTLYRRQKHIVKGCLVVSRPVAPAIVERLRKMLEQKVQGRVDFEVREDKNILGGFILEYDTYRLDASVRAQLSNIERALVK